MPAKPKSAMRTRAQDKSRQARADAKARKACVDAVWKRAGHLCERCRRRVWKPFDALTPFGVGHVHEVKPRSIGGDPTDPSGCLLLCFECHNRAHRLKVAK